MGKRVLARAKSDYRGLAHIHTDSYEGDLIDYYERSAPIMLPHVRERIVTGHRFLKRASFIRHVFFFCRGKSYVWRDVAVGKNHLW